MENSSKQRPPTENRQALLRVVWETSPGLAAWTALASLIVAVAPVGVSVATGALVSAVAVEQTDVRVVLPLAAFAACYLLGQLAAPFATSLASALGREVHGRVFARSMRATQRPTTIAHLEDPELLDLVYRAKGIPPFGPATAVGGLVALWSARVVAATSLAVVATFSWWYAAALTLAMVASSKLCRDVHFRLMTIVARNSGSTRGTASDGADDSLRRADYLRSMGMRPEPAMELRLFGLAGWLVGEFRQSWLAAMTQVWNERKGMGMRLSVALLPLGVVQVATIVAVAQAANRGATSVGRLVAYVQAIVGCAALVAGHDAQYRFEFGAGTVGAMRDLEQAVDSDDRLQPRGGSTHTAGAANAIRFDNVSFAYPGTAQLALDSFSLELPAGTSLGLVGMNGAGKTTVVKLLTRLYQPDAGVIWVDAIPLDAIDATAWQQQGAAVFQDFVRLPLSLRDNVSLTASAERVTRALAVAGADHLAESSPAGLDAMLSRRYEGGIEVSGGEWQRIALARAFAAIDAGATLLILDEPTAQLDARGEAEFYERFLDLTRGVTSVVISHRYSSVRNADRIAVVDRGRVIEQGTHRQLVDHGGRYAQSFSLQARRFAP